MVLVKPWFFDALIARVMFDVRWMLGEWKNEFVTDGQETAGAIKVWVKVTEMDQKQVPRKINFLFESLTEITIFDGNLRFPPILSQLSSGFSPRLSLCEALSFFYNAK